MTYLTYTTHKHSKSAQKFKNRPSTPLQRPSRRPRTVAGEASNFLPDGASPGRCSSIFSLSSLFGAWEKTYGGYRTRKALCLDVRDSSVEGEGPWLSRGLWGGCRRRSSHRECAFRPPDVSGVGAPGSLQPQSRAPQPITDHPLAPWHAPSSTAACMIMTVWTTRSCLTRGILHLAEVVPLQGTFNSGTLLHWDYS